MPRRPRAHDPWHDGHHSSRLLHERGRDATTPVRPVIIPVRRSPRLTDGVASTLSAADASGAIVDGSELPLIVTSRTHNDALTETYG